MVIDGLQQAGDESTVHLDGKSDDLSGARTNPPTSDGTAQRVRHYERWYDSPRDRKGSPRPLSDFGTGRRQAENRDWITSLSRG